MSSVQPILWILLFGFLVVACSENQGELVDKSPVHGSSSSGLVSTPNPPVSQGEMGNEESREILSIAPNQANSEALVSSFVRVASLNLFIDRSWKQETPQSSKRAAQFRLPAPEGITGDGELAIFEGIGGAAEANIERWILQVNDRVGEPTITKKRVGSFAIRMVDVSGTLNVSTMMGGSGEAKPGYRMLAAVVEGPGGGPWQFKLTGPHDTLEHWKASFESMIDHLNINQ